MGYSLGDAHVEQWQEEKDNMWDMAEDARQYLCEVDPSNRYAQAVYHFYLVARLQYLESKENCDELTEEEWDDYHWFEREMQRFGEQGRFHYQCIPPHEDYGIDFPEDYQSLDDGEFDKEGFLEALKGFEQKSLEEYEDDSDGSRHVIRDYIHEGAFQEIMCGCIHCDYMPDM